MRAARKALTFDDVLLVPGLAPLSHLPAAPVLDDAAVLAFVDDHTLMGTGLGWVDVHVLASACLGGQRLWTRDRRLAAAARRIGFAA